MKHKITLIFLLLAPAFLTAFIQNPVSLYALPLPEGRTYDQAHDVGLIDWSGPVGYVHLYHRDSTVLPPEEGGGSCGSGCWEWVTRISSGGSISGTLSPVGVSYFAVQVAASHSSGVGTATVAACSASLSTNLYAGPGGGDPGFFNFILAVPAGCTDWSLSASGGYVDFRAVTVNYSSIPPTVPANTPSPTETMTPIQTETFTPLPTATEAPTSTATETATPTASETPTATETLAPGVTPSDTPTPSYTPLPTSTNTPPPTGTMSETLPPGVTPIPPTSTSLSAGVSTNTPQPPSPGGGQGGNTPAVPFVLSPTAMQTRAAQSSTTAIFSPSTPLPASTSTPRPTFAPPAGELACTPSEGSDFPWWLLPGGMTIAAALSLLGSLLKNLDTASLTLGDLSVSPFGMTVPVPRQVQRKTTVGEWVTRPIRTFVEVTRTIWKTVTEAIPRFISVARQAIDRIVRSEWITTFRQVAKTFWEKVTEKVPLLGWLGKVIGFIWKTVVKPVIRWVTEAIRSLRTWVENIIRWVTQKIQDGWNYITRQISETIRQWVEKTDWVREWVTKEITVWETVWEQKFVAFPVPSGSGGLLAALTPQTWSSLLRTLGAGTALATLAATASMCATASDPCPTPTPDATGTTIAIYTRAPLTMTSQANQTAMAAGTPTPAPTGADNLNSNYSGLEHLNGWIQVNQAWLIANNYPTDAQYWQNYYNQQIIETANQYGISPALLKGLILRESNNAVTPIYIDSNGQPHLNYQAGGLVQLTGAGADTIFRYMDTPLAKYYYDLAYKYASQGGLALLVPGIPYKDLLPEQKLIIQDVVKQMFDGQCVQWEVTAGHCTPEQMTTPLLADGKNNITLGAINLTATQQDVINYVGQTNWASLPPAEQQKLIIATYKGGIGCIGNAIQNAQSADGGQIQSWNQIAQKLSGDCKGETELYVNSVLCYATNMSETQANSCASPNP